MRTTSGVSRRALSTACVPSEHSPTTSMSSSASRIIRKPARISAWSSTSSTRMLMPAPAVGWGAARAPRSRRPARGPPARAPVHRGALAHADEAVAAAGVAQLVVVARALAVVLDAQHDLVRLVRDRHAGARARRVLERVGERLLDDPVRRQVDPGGQLDRRRRSRAAPRAGPPRARGAPARRRARCSARPRAVAPSPRRTGPNRCRISASASRPVRSISDGRLHGALRVLLEHLRAPPPGPPSRSGCARARRAARARSGCARARWRAARPPRARAARAPPSRTARARACVWFRTSCPASHGTIQKNVTGKKMSLGS